MKKFFIISSAAFLFSIFSFIGIQAQNKDQIQDTVQSNSKDLIFSRVETEATFPGGQEAWSKYIKEEIEKSNLKKKDYGTCVVKFVVDKNGDISEVEATNSTGSALEKTAIDAIKNGPKWTPAQQNGRLVKAWRLQPVTFGPLAKERYYHSDSYSIWIKDITQNTVPKNYHKIAVFGAGSAAVRLIVDKIHENIAPGLKQKAIGSDYHFLGSDKINALEQFNKILKAEKYDAVMVLTQADISQITEMHYVEDLPFRRIFLDQAIRIQFYDLKDMENEIWQSMITMNMSLTRKKGFKDLSALILKSMKENLLYN